jgi:hypothetical protein
MQKLSTGSGPAFFGGSCAPTCATANAQMTNSARGVTKGRGRQPLLKAMLSVHVCTCRCPRKMKCWTLQVGELSVAACVNNGFFEPMPPGAIFSLAGHAPFCHCRLRCRQIIAERGNRLHTLVLSGTAVIGSAERVVVKALLGGKSRFGYMGRRTSDVEWLQLCYSAAPG